MSNDAQVLLERARALSVSLEQQFPGSKAELEDFPSGAFMLNVRRAGRFFVLAYIRSSSWFGVDEVRDEDGFGDHYRFGSQSFDEAARELERLLAAA
jgi:hypothetical protein